MKKYLFVICLIASLLNAPAFAKGGNTSGGGDLYVVSQVLRIYAKFRRDFPRLAPQILDRRDYREMTKYLRARPRLLSFDELEDILGATLSVFRTSVLHADRSGYSVHGTKFDRLLSTGWDNKYLDAILFTDRPFWEGLTEIRRERYLFYLVCRQTDRSDCTTKAERFREALEKEQGDGASILLPAQNDPEIDLTSESWISGFLPALKTEMQEKRARYSKKEWKKIERVFAANPQIKVYSHTWDSDSPGVETKSAYSKWSGKRGSVSPTIYIDAKEWKLPAAEADRIAFLHHEICVLAGIEASGVYETTLRFIEN